MPTYLARAFRWHRQSIIIHCIVQNLDDCSPNWISSPSASACILQSFSSLYNFPPPATTTAPFTLVEEYDPCDLSSDSAPYAYVADHVVKIDLSCDVADEIKKYDDGKQEGLLEKLRDEIEKGEKVKWYVIVCGDEERGWPGKDEDEEGEEDEEGDEEQVEREKGGD
ncbi:hypothetical protein QBC38DRAFT_245050 [Podospora fimiseda]|uniref:Uncharacterized protein n=1 Tax=Podospora fimiseda TaxID=252190 RepID=A0AAN7BX91_9PEZI|nr:hypothetical protein QBC38DRAFT_245050 [Podospora fimiseda]